MICDETENTMPDLSEITSDTPVYTTSGLKLEMLKQTVEARSRRLSAQWTFEVATDIVDGNRDTPDLGQITSDNPVYESSGTDIENEIRNALAAEITAEIDEEILADLRGSVPAQAHSTIDASDPLPLRRHLQGRQLTGPRSTGPPANHV